MRKIKNVVSFLLAFVMIFSMVISPSALVVNNNDTVYSAYGNRAVVIGKAADYAEQLVTVLLLEGDGQSATYDDILYMDTVQADEDGYYEVKIKYDGFVIEDGVVKNCALKVRAGADEITDTVLSAKVEKSDMLAVELETELSEDSASVVANLNNLYGQSLDALVMIAAYDENNKLLGVKMADKLISDEKDSISVDYKNLPTLDRLVAYVWESSSSLIPYMEGKEIDVPNAVKNIVIQPGSDETERRFAWYNTQETSGAQIQYALKADYEAAGNRFTAENSKIVEGITETPYENTTDLSCKVEIDNLQLGTEYVYRVGSARSFDDNVYSFKTYDVKNSDKQVFAIVSDIHNAMNSYETLNDETPKKQITYCDNVYKSLMLQYPETQFIVSAGDNMSIGGNGYSDYETNYKYYLKKAELEMDQLFTPNIFREVPFISAIGNHETMLPGKPFSGVTKYHYNVPNEDESGAYVNTNQHGNWWFRNGDVLIISILLHKTPTTGAYVNVTAEANKAFIQEALAKNSDAKWKILVNHVPAYSSVVHTGEEDDVRNLFADLDLDNLDIDAVISGHQHAYSRSKQLLTNKYETTEYIDYTNSKGAAISLMKPIVVSEEDITDSEDENGYQIDSATNPEGIVHIDVASMTNSAHNCFVPDVTEICEAYGVTSPDDMVYPDGTAATDATGDAIVFSPSSYLIVTVEKNDDGSEQIKFEFVKNNVTRLSTGPSEEGTVLDTYIIKKTFD